jgi:hypothetical protein
MICDTTFVHSVCQTTSQFCWRKCIYNSEAMTNTGAATQEVLGLDFILAHGDAASLYENASN